MTYGVSEQLAELFQNASGTLGSEIERMGITMCLALRLCVAP
jgi:hypothetical protein